MAEYIERKAVKAAVRKRLNNSLIIGWLISIINEVPAADAAPVVRGKWTEKDNRIYDPLLCDDVHWSTYICSECNGEVMKDFCYCPNCGAHMEDGE